MLPESVAITGEDVGKPALKTDEGTMGSLEKAKKQILP